MKVLSVVYWSMASPWTGYSKRARCAWTWRGGPSRAGISTSCYRQLSFHASYPGPAQSPHAQWLPSKPPHTLTRTGVVFPRDFCMKMDPATMAQSPAAIGAQRRVRSAELFCDDRLVEESPNPAFSKGERGDSLRSHFGPQVLV